MQDLTRGLTSPGLMSLLYARELEVEIEITQPSIVIETDLLVDMMRTDGFGIVADVIHDPTLEVELEITFDASAGWPLVSELATSVLGAARSPQDLSSATVVFDPALTDPQPRVQVSDGLGDAWFLASEELVAATETVWLPPVAAPRVAMPVRLALIAAAVAAVIALVAALG